MDPIYDWLVNFVQQIASYLVQLIQWIWSVLVQVANFLWSVLLKSFNFAWSFLKKAATLFRTIWDGFFKKIWNAVLKAIQKAHAWLEAKLAPILNFLKRLRQMYDRWFRAYIKPLLTFLQRIRKVIAILRMLHIHILDGLDKQIAKIESKISQAVLTMRGILNNLIDLVNIIADPMQILRRPTLVYSIRRIALSLVKVFTGLPPGYFFPSPRKSAPKGTGFLPINFNNGDPIYDPPASSYLGNDGLPGGFSGFTAGIEPDDSAVNDLAMLDYFDGELYDDPACSDPAGCFAEAFRTFTTVGLNA